MSLQVIVIVIVNVIAVYEAKVNTFSQIKHINRPIFHEIGRLMYEIAFKQTRSLICPFAAAVGARGILL